MKTADRSTHKPAPMPAPHFVEQPGQAGPRPDARERLADFYRRNPPKSLKAGQQGIVESLKADRDRR